ncbi:Tetraspanin-19 like [Actinidia chinensis var. chinensis]|uniref:Tetraspanin-19 like n=1 Tax=Actinidia chinensis var. chinensis TaxID=1590841 RepID=A0A2R6QZL2_ACTCC|nr:Tetraspanin-19 like [Actinidia chinensis var. chinensis]
MMIGCNRYRLYNSWRVVNVIVNVFGMGMIIYSLWLLKMWIQGVDRLPAPVELPRPWFIHVCLGVGIIVCMSTLSGHMVANCISKSVLGVYIVSIFSLLLIQVGMIVAVLFRINWDGEIMRYIDGRHNKFKGFLLFHIVICRLISILALVAQTNVIVLAAIVWAVGGEPAIHRRISGPFDIRQSFMMDYNSPVLSDRGRLEETLKSYMDGILRNPYCQIIRNQS